MDLGLSGLASGFDWRTLVDQLTDLDRVPQRRLRSEQFTLDLRKNAYGSISTQLGILQNRVENLQDPDLFQARKSTSSDESIATAQVSAGALAGTYSFAITQLATASSQQGASNIGSPLNATADVSGLILSEADLATPITSGTFTVNGQQITVDPSESLQDVFDNISAATGGSVTASYTPGTDSVTLSSGSEIILGSATDTSNFLQALKLHNNGTGTIDSIGSLGVVRTNTLLQDANLNTPITDGGAGAGEFTINGVSIAYDASTDAIADVLARINNSDAEVLASYDSINDRFTLTNEKTGDLGISLQDVTGNFLAATGLSGGSLNRGNNLLYSVNGGGQQISQSNTISESDSPVQGLSLSALETGVVTIKVSNDSDKVKTAITDFIEEYNKSQSMIDAETASTTDEFGEVTTGDLAGESEANELASRLRSIVNSLVTGAGSVINRLDDLGISSNGTDDTIELKDSQALDDALANDLDDIRDLFTNDTDGLAVQLKSFLEATTGDEGSLQTKQENLARQIANIDTQISDMERLVLANEERLLTSFIAMEDAQARSNQQLNFLLQRFGSA